MKYAENHWILSGAENNQSLLLTNSKKPFHKKEQSNLCFVSKGSLGQVKSWLKHCQIYLYNIYLYSIPFQSDSSATTEEPGIVTRPQAALQKAPQAAQKAPQPAQRAPQAAPQRPSQTVPRATPSSPMFQPKVAAMYQEEEQDLSQTGGGVAG